MDPDRPIGTGCLRDLPEPLGDLTSRLRHTASSRSLDKLDHPPSARGAVGRAGDGVLLTPAKRREGYGAPRRETCFRRLDDDMRLVDQRIRRVELALEEMNID